MSRDVETPVAQTQKSLFAQAASLLFLQKKNCFLPMKKATSAFAEVAFFSLVSAFTAG